MENCRANAEALKEGIVKTGLFNILSKDVGVPVVAFSLKDASEFDEYELSAQLRTTGWIVPAYTMAPNCKDLRLLRVVIREDFSRTLCERLLEDLDRALKKLQSNAVKTSEIVAKALADDALAGKHLDLEVEKKAVVLAAKSPDIFQSVVRAQKAVRLWKQKSGQRSNNGVC